MGLVPRWNRDQVATKLTASYADQPMALDLQALVERLNTTGPYTYEDARREMRVLIAAVQALEEREDAVAHLIRLAISHGVTPAALDRLNDALVELERPPGARPAEG